MKTCSACARTLPHADFYKHNQTSDRLDSYCKACRKAKTNLRYAAKAKDDKARHKQIRLSNTDRTDAQVLDDQSRLLPEGRKVCRSCRDGLPLNRFRVDRTRGDGLCPQCRLCEGADLRAIAQVFWDTQGVAWECWYCEAPAQSVDHVVPRSRGGKDIPQNLIPACVSCNSSKRDTPVITWLSRRYPLLLNYSWPAGWLEAA